MESSPEDVFVDIVISFVASRSLKICLRLLSPPSGTLLNMNGRSGDAMLRRSRIENRSSRIVDFPAPFLPPIMFTRRKLSISRLLKPR